MNYYSFCILLVLLLQIFLFYLCLSLLFLLQLFIFFLPLFFFLSPPFIDFSFYLLLSSFFSFSSFPITVSCTLILTFIRCPSLHIFPIHNHSFLHGYAPSNDRLGEGGIEKGVWSMWVIMGLGGRTSSQPTVDIRMEANLETSVRLQCRVGETWSSIFRQNISPLWHISLFTSPLTMVTSVSVRR